MAKIQVLVDADLEPIMPRYMEIQKKELTLLDAAVAAGNGDEIRLLGHKMKGSGTSFGFPEISFLGQEIENAGKIGDMIGAATLITKVRDYLANVEVTYKEMD